MSCSYKFADQILWASKWLPEFTDLRGGARSSRIWAWLHLAVIHPNPDVSHSSPTQQALPSLDLLPASLDVAVSKH